MKACDLVAVSDKELDVLSVISKMSKRSALTILSAEIAKNTLYTHKRQVPGVVSSLCRKGLVDTKILDRKRIVWLTSAGLEAVSKLF